MFWKLNLQMCVKTGKMCVKLFACAKGFALSPQFFSMKTLRNCVSASKVFSHSYRLSPSDQASHTIFDEQKHFLERERGDTYLSFYISLSTQMFSIISKNYFFPIYKNYPLFQLFLSPCCNTSAYSIRLANWQARQSKQEGIIFL